MARSLTIQHEEKATAHPLLLGFLLLACAWLAASTLIGAGAVTDVATTSPVTIVSE